MLPVTVLSQIEYDGTTYAPGVHVVGYEIAQALQLRGPARPATQAEIAEAHAQAQSRSGVERAEAQPRSETAARRHSRAPRKLTAPA